MSSTRRHVTLLLLIVLIGHGLERFLGACNDKFKNVPVNKIQGEEEEGLEGIINDIARSNGILRKRNLGACPSDFSKIQVRVDELVYCGNPDSRVRVRFSDGKETVFRIFIKPPPGPSPPDSQDLNTVILVSMSDPP